MPVMNVLAAAQALNRKAAEQKWHHFCDPTLAFNDPVYQQFLTLWRTKAGARAMPKSPVAKTMESGLAALIQGQGFDDLDAPVERVTGADVPMPYSKRLEQAAIPHAEHVGSAALASLEGSR